MANFLIFLLSLLIFIHSALCAHKVLQLQMVHLLFPLSFKTFFIYLFTLRLFYYYLLCSYFAMVLVHLIKHFPTIHMHTTFPRASIK